MTTNDPIKGRMSKLLARVDKLTTEVAQLHDEQQMRVRNQGGRERLNGYRACQFSASATRLLAQVRAQLFTDPTVNYNGKDGEVATEQNEEWLCLRFHDTAGGLGLTFEDVADAVLQTAEDCCDAAQNAHNEAKLWAVANAASFDGFRFSTFVFHGPYA